MSDLLESKWYAVYCKSRHEARVWERLRKKGFEAFLADYEARVQWGKRWRKTRRNLLPGYVLVRTVLTPRTYLQVLQTESVVKFVDRPWPNVPSIPEEQVNSLRLLLNTGHPFVQVPHFEGGTEVEVIAGALRGLCGRVVQTSKNKSRVVVSIDLLKRSVEITIDAAFLRCKTKSLAA
ncbi:MAG: hypothetical protein D6743_18075 [Calditrichaeota bacterium]|nr:MAG: hypothetical protein D6743_18075 [Calditrichota bacterium]